VSSKRVATHRTFEPIERGRQSLSELDTLIEAALWGFAHLHNKHEEFTDPRKWMAFCEAVQMPFSMQARYDFALEQTAEQARRGFPLFFEMAIISLASIVDASVRDFARRWLRDHGPSWQLDSIVRIELPAATFVAKNHADRTSMIFDRLEQSLRGSVSGRTARPGVEPLQRLLGALDIAPVVPEEICLGINELTAVRNQLVHHGGRVDARFAQLCPELAKRRRRIVVNQDRFVMYQQSASRYLTLIVHAAGKVAGFEIE
jgi:hypothetical protein